MSTKVDVPSDGKLSYVPDAGSSSTCTKHEYFSDMLLWLRTAAIDPCNPRRSSEKVRRRQILNAREVLYLSSTEMSWKRRKLHRIQEKSRVPPVVSVKKPYEQSSFATQVSCFIKCSDSNKISEHNILNPPNSTKSIVSHDNLSRKRIRNSHSFKCNDSISGSYSSSEQKLECHTQRSQMLKSSNILPLKRPGMLQVDPTNKNLLPGIDSNDSVDSSSESNLDNPKQHKTPRRSLRLLNFIGDYLPRMPIPIGPHFQADIPDCIGPPTRENSGDARCISKDSRFLGTKIWPIEDKIPYKSSKGIGRGRPYSCSCNSSGSIKCVKRHIFEKRQQLQDDLGPAFFSWRFDEMGEEVSKSWTLNDQKSFNILFPKCKSFLKTALKLFPSKCRMSIVSYYFNVYALRLLSKQTRLASKSIDNEDNDEDEVIDMVSTSTSIKTQYLIKAL